MSGSLRYGRSAADTKLVDDDQPLPTKSMPGPRKLLDYDVRTDTNPVYIGTNEQSALVADATWLIQKLAYDGDARVVDVQILVGAWTNRASLSWKSSGGD